MFLQVSSKQLRTWLVFVPQISHLPITFDSSLKSVTIRLSKSITFPFRKSS
ncbi:MAG: hypothetical protein RI530_05420 [Microbacteriaceae bacterium]|nr:hypothetical protein [Microbacteriaceae bacterium]